MTFRRGRYSKRRLASARRGDRGKSLEKAEKNLAVSYLVGDDDVSSIGVREWGEGGLLVELRGEFDQYNLEDLKDALSDVVALRRPTLVDLSEVTFLDIGATRELTTRSRLHAYHLALCYPSWQVRASVAACGFDALLEFRFGTDDPAYGCPKWRSLRKRPSSQFSPDRAEDTHGGFDTRETPSQDPFLSFRGRNSGVHKG